jgi:hypothetical protein
MLVEAPPDHLQKRKGNGTGKSGVSGLHAADQLKYDDTAPPCSLLLHRILLMVARDWIACQCSRNY